MPPSASRPKRVLVTGGRGRLASLIADYFRAPVHEVVLFSRGGGLGFRELSQLPQTVESPEPTALLHLAWSSLPATAEQHPDAGNREDLPLLQKLLQAAIAPSHERRPHLVFFSSGGAVYGNAPQRPSRETDDCHPIGRYGRAKRSAEELILAAAREHDLPCAILRISNPYGYPVPSGRAQGIIPHAIRCAVEGKPLTLWGDGHARKDFLYYTDFLSALQEVVDRRLTGVFNIAAGESHSVHEILTLIEQHTGKKIETKLTPAPVWDVQDSRLDHGLFSATTGWEPQVSLNEGIRRSVGGYLDH